MINFVKNHFLSLNRILENRLLLNTIYLILIIILFTICLIFFLFDKKNQYFNFYFPFLIDSIFIELIIWIIPTLIILGIGFYSVKSSFLINPLNKIYNNIKPLIVEIVSMNWKWMIIYPLQKVVSFNEICLPTLVPINLFLTSNSIMNSLCIPKYGIQFYCMSNCHKTVSLLILKHGFCHGISNNFSGNGFPFLKINIFSIIKKSFFYWINNIQNFNFLNISDYNKLSKPGFFFHPKFFKIRNNKIFLSIIKKNE
ncbi:cytochrome O ubiquinol oxidase subunit II [Candidatus Carsonella ruddii]|uniref:Cytochrome O ubiquinol oxidase subunit II n=1 Tax=Carsonella ruddii TaxID=114186 RepID=A0AAE7KLG7_CARRU|nr:cytochrome O ubiquinol oxidase subunit II [Candidatus Carsonella ruddii]AGS06686.1 cytochrome O ubiquinol oxidase subunit II [Candidatus Carsonella ruddii DC]ALA96913.1 hypothetical protein AMC76_01065 [Candidatus Carsonella ruddii]QLK14159.1 hypothetical protein FK493_01075 [Candidatus Carsonella ruddii]